MSMNDPQEQPKAYAADAKRRAVEYRGESMYVVIVPSEREIFVSSVVEDLDPKTRAAINCMTRLVTLSWNCAGLDKTLKQMDRSSEVKADLPGLFAALIREEVE